MTTGSRSEAPQQQMTFDRVLALARDVAAQTDGGASISRAIDLASKVVDCVLVDVVRVHVSGALQLVASMDLPRSAVLVRLSEACAATPAAVCSSATTSADTSAVVSDLASDERWPRYARAVVETTGLLAEMAIGLDVTDETCLVMRFFADRPDPWPDAVRRQAIAFAGWTALAIDRAALRDTAANLRLALESNRTIGAAIGVLMSRRRVGEQAAFDLLRVASQHSNRRLKSIADEVVLTGDLPGGTGGPA